MNIYIINVLTSQSLFTFSFKYYTLLIQIQIHWVKMHQIDFITMHPCVCKHIKRKISTAIYMCSFSQVNLCVAHTLLTAFRWGIFEMQRNQYKNAIRTSISSWLIWMRGWANWCCKWYVYMKGVNSV